MQPQDHLLLSREAEDALRELTTPLLKWYDQNKRSLPWRDEPTPYHVWVSEIMLQQTRVEAVRGYYTRFLQALPDIAALAQAPEEQLLKLWEGLGYYNRVRNLQKSARMAMRQFEGALPASYGALLSLPGIGEYTAGAIASIAFGIPVPAVDGNVLRVLSRICGCSADIALPAVKDCWRRLLPAAIPPARPGDFNQSLMELGATVCLPNGAPLCARCPVENLCIARHAGIQLELPVKAPKKARQVEQRTIVLVIAGSRVLLRQRGERLLGGMYEPLNLPDTLDRQAVTSALQELGAQVTQLTPMRESKHLFTHIEWRMQGYLAHCSAFEAPDGAVWADRADLGERYALPSAFRAYTRELPLLLENDA